MNKGAYSSPDSRIPFPKKINEKIPKTTISWHDSSILRTAAGAAFIILCGYLASIIISINGIESVSQIAYDPQIDEVLANHLSGIKEIHVLKQEILVLQLNKALKSFSQPKNPEQLTPDAILRWLQLGGFDKYFNPNKINIRRISPKEKKQTANISWINRSQLRIFDSVVELDDGDLKQEFVKAEGLKQRYELIGATWNEHIRPSFINVNILIMLMTFLLFAGSIFVIARHLKKRIEIFLQGFAVWSEKDHEYRFGDDWKGELKMISLQFNRMAEIVEANRKRRLYLEKMSSWQIIARKLAHEIKNPLTPIQMMISQVVRRYPDDDSDFGKLLHKCHVIIIEEVNRLRHMVDNFSKFAQLPAPNFDSSDLIPICQQAIEMEEVVFGNHQFTFTHKVDQAITLVDKNLLKQTLINLLKNAAESCGEQPSEISIDLDMNEQNIIIHVSDNGPGIPKELQSRIFEAYFTTKDTGPSPGMGLGLAVCQKIIIDHGGELQVNSRPGKTCFTIILPKK